jgi:hypothetical protein
MGRTRERGHVRLHKGYWWGILPTMTREDGPSVRPWFKPEENTEAAAEVLLARKLVELDENRLPAPTADTVAGWIEQFLAHHDVEPSTLSGYRQALRRRIEHPTIGIGRIKLQKLTAVRLDRFYRDLKDDGYAKATIQQTHRLLSVALKEAVRKRKLSYSPVPDATLPRFERRSRKALLVDRKKLWTPSELQAFMAHTRDDRWYPVWYVLASTGMRRSEICGLRTESVDVERAVITVDWKVVSIHNKLYEGRTRRPCRRPGHRTVHDRLTRSASMIPAALCGPPPGVLRCRVGERIGKRGHGSDDIAEGRRQVVAVGAERGAVCGVGRLA